MALATALLAPASAGAAKAVRTNIKLPSAGDVTLARVLLEVKAKKGRALPKRLRLRATVRNRKRLPRGADAFVTTRKLKPRRRAAGRRKAVYAGLVAITRKGGAGASGQGGEREFVAAMFWALVGGQRDAFIAPPDSPAEARNAFGAPRAAPTRALCIDDVANFEGFVVPPLEDMLTSPGADLYAEVMQDRFTRKDNLLYAFGAGCGIETIKVPDRWFESRDLSPPQPKRNCSTSSSTFKVGSSPAAMSLGVACTEPYSGFTLAIDRPISGEVTATPSNVSCTTGEGLSCVFNGSPGKSIGTVFRFADGADATCADLNGAEVSVVFPDQSSFGPITPRC